jgi:hypothetical protein
MLEFGLGPSAQLQNQHKTGNGSLPDIFSNKNPDDLLRLRNCLERDEEQAAVNLGKNQDRL